MALTLSLISGPSFSGKEKRYVFGAVLTDNYPGSGGDTVDFTPWISGNVAELPISVLVEGAAGYPAAYTEGSDLSDGQLTFYKAVGTELDTAAYQAALLAAADLRLTVVL